MNEKPRYRLIIRSPGQLKAFHAVEHPDVHSLLSDLNAILEGILGAVSIEGVSVEITRPDIAKEVIDTRRRLR